MDLKKKLTFEAKIENIQQQKSLFPILTFDTSLKSPETDLSTTKISFGIFCCSYPRGEGRSDPSLARIVLKITKKSNISENYRFFTFHTFSVRKFEFYIKYHTSTKNFTTSPLLDVHPLG